MMLSMEGVAVSVEVDKGFTFLPEVGDTIILMVGIAVEALLSVFKDLSTEERSYSSIQGGENKKS